MKEEGETDVCLSFYVVPYSQTLTVPRPNSSEQLSLVFLETSDPSELKLKSGLFIFSQKVSLGLVPVLGKSVVMKANKVETNILLN